jgi:hypothetical protein
VSILSLDSVDDVVEKARGKRQLLMGNFISWSSVYIRISQNDRLSFIIDVVASYAGTRALDLKRIEFRSIFFLSFFFFFLSLDCPHRRRYERTTMNKMAKCLCSLSIDEIYSGWAPGWHQTKWISSNYGPRFLRTIQLNRIHCFRPCLCIGVGADTELNGKNSWQFILSVCDKRQTKLYRRPKV